MAPHAPRPITQGSSQPTRLAISASGQRIAVAWAGGAGITVHDAASGALLVRFKEHRFALRPDGKWLACQENSDIVLLPIASGEQVSCLASTPGPSLWPSAPTGPARRRFDRLLLRVRPHHRALGHAEARAIRHASGPPRTGHRRGVQSGRRVDRHRKLRLHHSDLGDPDRAEHRDPSRSAPRVCGAMVSHGRTSRGERLKRSSSTRSPADRVQQWLTGHRIEQCA